MRTGGGKADTLPAAAARIVTSAIAYFEDFVPDSVPGALLISRAVPDDPRRKPHTARSIERRRRAQAIVSVAPRLPLRRLTAKESLAILAELEDCRPPSSAG
jgi:hypothetical protein